MRKKIMILSICFILLSVFTVIFRKKVYIIDIPQTDMVTKIIYQASSGDIYEVVEKDIIKEFIDSIDGKKFVEKESYENRLWSPSTAILYSSNGEEIFELEFLGDNKVLIDMVAYECEEKFNKAILANNGNLIGNIYDE